jgi:beta-1,2-mannosidase
LFSRRDLARKSIALALILVFASLVLATRREAETRGPDTNANPFGAWRRVSNGPILSPQDDGWESAGTFNPAVIFVAGEPGLPVKNGRGKFVMLYRAQDRAGTSRLGYAESTNGIHFTRLADPVFSPAADYEKDGGVEDPRLQKIDDTFYLTYTGYNKKQAQLCLATSHDLLHWERKGVIVPAYQGNWNVAWTKSGAIVPTKIDGKYWMYWLGTAADKTDQMGLSYSTDLLHWIEAANTPVLPRRAGKFDSRVVEPGPPPILTTRGIVLVYNGADDRLVYRTGVAIFDPADPRKLVWRTDEPVFAPEKDWEKIGQVPNVVFVEGMAPVPAHSDSKSEEFLFYYGAADKYIGVARAKMQQTPSKRK